MEGVDNNKKVRPQVHPRTSGPNPGEIMPDNDLRPPEDEPAPDPGAIPSPDFLEEPPLLARLVSEEPVPAVLLVKPPHPGFWWAALWCLGYLTITQLTMIIIFVPIFLVLLLRTPDGARQFRDPQALLNAPEFAQAMGPALFGGQILGILGSWVAVRLVVGREWTRILALRRPSLTHLFLSILGLPGMIVLAVGVDLVGKEFLPTIVDLDEVSAVFGHWPLGFAVLAVGFGPGLAEELFCRGFLGRGLVGRQGMVGGVLLTSLLFGLMHMEPRQVLYTFLMGILLHLAYLATRSLWIPILMHVLNNSLAVLMLHLPKEWAELDRHPDRIPGYIFPAAGLLVAGVGWALYQSRARLVDRGPSGMFSWAPYPGVEYPSAQANAFVTHSWPSWSGWAAAAVGVLVFAGAFWGLWQSVQRL
jgi:membrane protease YdiL (CAAX protease family)